MKRRILALMLCLVTLLTMLVSCQKEEISDEDLNKEQSVRTAVSINMWVVTENKISAETEALIEEAFNRITKSRFTTYVDLIFCTESEYNDALDARFEAIKAAEVAAELEEQRKKEEARSLKAAGITTVAQTTVAETTVITEEATIVNDYGVVELKYPEIPEDQIDIVLVLGRERLEELVANAYLEDLDDEISETGTSKALNDYIHPVLFNHTKIEGSTYAIPNNHVIGEYTYLLINREMAEKYYIHEANISDFKDCLDLIENIKTNETIAPVKAPFDDYLTYFWGEDIESDGFSVLASTYTLSMKQIGVKLVNSTSPSNQKMNVTDVFSTKYAEHLIRMKKYEEGGYFAKTENEAFGVGIVSGDYALRFEYEDDYIVKAIKTPIATEEDVFSSFFAVSTFTANIKRSMEVITLINTTSELRNLLQYGIEDVHYVLDDDGKVQRLNNDYMMDSNKTGNVFMAYPEEGMDLDAWTYGKLQNSECAAHVILGFREVWGNVNTETMQRIAALSKEYKDKIDACKTAEELEAFCASAKAELGQNADIKYMKTMNNADIADSIAQVYLEWYNTGWPSNE